MLTPREIIAEAWTITTTQKSLKRWGFFGSFFRLLLDIKLLTYQAYFGYEYFIKGGEEVGFFDVEIWLVNSTPVWVWSSILGAFIIMFIAEIFVPSLADGAIIGLAAKAHSKQEGNGGVILAMYNFFPIFVIHEIFVFTGLPTLITICSIILRYGAGLTSLLLVVTFIIWIFSSVLRFFCSFAEEAIVIEKMNPFVACGKSLKITVSYFHRVLFLILLLAVIFFRILINSIITLLIPFVILSIAIGFTYITTPIISYTIAGVISIAIVFVAAYFFAYLHVFTQTVWTIMYMQVIQEKELDVIA